MILNLHIITPLTAANPWPSPVTGRNIEIWHRCWSVWLLRRLLWTKLDFCFFFLKNIAFHEKLKRKKVVAREILYQEESTWILHERCILYVNLSVLYSVARFHITACNWRRPWPTSSLFENISVLHVILNFIPHLPPEILVSPMFINPHCGRRPWQHHPRTDFCTSMYFFFFLSFQLCSHNLYLF